MTERLWRSVVATIGVAAALIVCTAVEQHRSVLPPGGWTLAAGEPVAIERDVPLILQSRWRLGTGAQWRADVDADQWFFRPLVAPGAAAVIELADAADGLIVRLPHGQTPSVNLRSGEAGPCEGELPIVAAEDYPLVITRTDGGVLFASKELKMACLGAVGSPVLRAEGEVVRFASIGQDGHPVGQPMAPLEWLAGVVFVGFCMMMVLELERSRGMGWPVIVATGAPAWVGALLLFVAPGATTPGFAGVHISLVFLVGVVALKAGALLVARPVVSDREE